MDGSGHFSISIQEIIDAVDEFYTEVIKPAAKKTKSAICGFIKKTRNVLSSLPGTISIGRSASFYTGIWSFNGQAFVSSDFKGNIALQYTYAGGLSVGPGEYPTWFAGSFCMVTNAPTVQQLNDYSLQVGASKSVPIPDTPICVSNGFEYNRIGDGDSPYHGLTATYGISGGPGGEGHVEWGNTSTILSFNIYDVILELLGGE